MKLYVIAGHGGNPYDPGACAGGYEEAKLVRQLAALMKALGGDQVEVLDTSIDWYATGRVDSALKAKMGNNPGVELHMDSASASAQGGHVCIASGLAPDNYDKALAEAIHAFFPGRSVIIDPRTNIANLNRAKNLGINYRLLECCFISDTEDRTKFINQMGDVAKLILKAFGIGTEGDWLSMATLEEVRTAVWGADLNGVMARDRLIGIDGKTTELIATDDPTGRGVEMNDHDHIKWMAAKQAAMDEKLDRIMEMLTSN